MLGHKLTTLLLLASVSLAQQPLSPATVIDQVNVFTGTSNSRWMLFPGASTPLGLVKFSPDNQGNVWDGGYEYTVGSIAGFSFLHTLGLNSFSLMPLAGSLENEPGQPKLFAGPADGPFGQMWTAGFRSRIDKRTEVGRPGYYAVDLLDAQTRVEVTATDRTGWMRFTPSPVRPTHLILDFAQPAEEQGDLLNISVHQVSAHELTGSLSQRNHYAGQFTVFFDLQLSRDATSMGSWQNEALTSSGQNYGDEWRRPRTVHPNVTTFDSTKSGGVWLDLDAGTPGLKAPIVIRTGISLVGLDQAHNNLAVESAPFGFDFDAVASAAARTWTRLLSSIDVEGGSADDRVKLYTNLYRTYTGKALVDDVDGSFRDACGAVQHLPPASPGQASKLHLYSSDALWGAQWDLGPLWSLVDPETLAGFNRAMVYESQLGGWLPSNTPNLHYSAIMDAHHEMAFLTGAWMKGIRSFDGPAAYAAMRKVLTSPSVPYTCNGQSPEGIAGDRHMAAYMKLGYVPEEDGPASSTYEYAYDDSCAATFARALNKPEDAALFSKRSQNWHNSFNPATGYPQRRHADGAWASPADPHLFGTTGGWSGPGFLEGTAWIYTWFVPQDVPALVQTLGRDRFNQRLEEGFQKNFVDLTNEPNLQAPWLFNYSGRPDLTQKYARDVFSRVFDTSPLNGWPGEEDEGQMGAYVVLAGIGLFDMQGGCADYPEYQISGPAFTRVTLHLAGGGDFRILARNNSPTNIYIQSATLSGKPLPSLAIRHDQIVPGGELVLTMGNKPLRGNE